MGYWEDEDYWDSREQPYDEPIDQFLTSMKELVRHDVKKELEELRAFKKKWEKLANSSENLDWRYEQRVKQLEYEKRDEIQKIKREQKYSGLKDLLVGHEFEVWDVAYATVYADKCDKCDDNRKVSYKTPLGREAKENCDCNKRKLVYEPIPFTLYQIGKNRDNKVTLLYKFKDYKNDPHWSNLTYFGSWSDEVNDTKSHKDIITDPEDFEHYRSWDNLFATEELAKEYCEWRNAKTEWEEASSY